MENLSDLNVVGFIHFIQLYLQKTNKQTKYTLHPE